MVKRVLGRISDPQSFERPTSLLQSREILPALALLLWSWMTLFCPEMSVFSVSTLVKQNWAEKMVWTVSVTWAGSGTVLVLALALSAKEILLEGAAAAETAVQLWLLSVQLLFLSTVTFHSSVSEPMEEEDWPDYWQELSLVYHCEK